jgi:hypothetical protein
MKVLYTVVSYAPLWASCLAVCLGLTLMMVVRVPELVTPPLRVILVRVSSYAELFFLLCMGQWIYLLLLIALMLGAFGGSFRRWSEEPTGLSLRQAYWALLLAGCLGLADALNWFPVFLRFLSHPIVSVGLTVLVLAAFCRFALAGARRGSPSR